MHLMPIVRFSKQLRRDLPYKAGNWHALSHRQYLSTHYFLDICSLVFNYFLHLQFIFTSMCDICIFLENESYVKRVI